MIHPPRCESGDTADVQRANHPGAFDVREKWIDDIAVLAVCSDLDMVTAPLLVEAIGEIVTKRPAGLIIDLTEVELLAPPGMSALMVAQRLTKNVAELAVVAAGPTTSRPMAVMGLDRVLRIYSSLADALAEVR